MVTRISALLALAPLLAAAPALAQPAATGQSCARIDDEAKRLLCYDLVFRTGVPGIDPSTPLPPPKAAAVEAEGVDSWPLTTAASPTGKGMFMTLTNISLEPLPDSDQSGRITISCAGTNTSLSFWFPGFYMSSDERVVEASYDGGKAETYEAGGFDAQMSISGAKSIPIIKQLMAANKVKVSAKPSSGPKVSAEFDLAGLTKAMTPLREACGW